MTANQDNTRKDWRTQPQTVRLAGRYFVGCVEAYCENENCMVRQVDVMVKNHDDDPAPRFKCPACGSVLNVHAVKSMEEREDELDESARCRVNVQRYIRDNCEPGGFVIYPMSVACDDTLPQ